LTLFKDNYIPLVLKNLIYSSATSLGQELLPCFPQSESGSWLNPTASFNMPIDSSSSVVTGKYVHSGCRHPPTTETEVP